MKLPGIDPITANAVSLVISRHAISRKIRRPCHAVLIKNDCPLSNNMRFSLMLFSLFSFLTRKFAKDCLFSMAGFPFCRLFYETANLKACPFNRFTELKHFHQMC
jgi:hypothetical protein